MPIRLKKLSCRVKVRTKSTEPIQHRTSPAQKPRLQFALPVGQERVETSPEPTKMATEERGLGSGEQKPKAAPRKADPRAVADRVYELMMQEMRLARQRSGRH